MFQCRKFWKQSLWPRSFPLGHYERAEMTFCEKGILGQSGGHAQAGPLSSASSWPGRVDRPGPGPPHHPPPTMLPTPDPDRAFDPLHRISGNRILQRVTVTDNLASRHSWLPRRSGVDAGNKCVGRREEPSRGAAPDRRRVCQGAPAFLTHFPSPSSSGGTFFLHPGLAQLMSSGWGTRIPWLPDTVGW